jgi:murein L,D-transpeptidase YcbB/YkuD
MWEEGECSFEWENSRRILTREEIRNFSITQDQVNGIELPFFEGYESFRDSDFFSRYYDLWEENISFSRDDYFLQLHSLDVQAYFIEKLQRILVVLWCLEMSDFIWNYCDISPEERDCERISELRYFWVFWPKTYSAVRAFQREFSLPDDGIVWEQTRTSLYQTIFHSLHNSLRQNCYTETQQEIQNINMQ